jgi:DUF4097 and DUF4098 domain-containing protein YvlB
MNGMTKIIDNFVQRFATMDDYDVSETTTETHPVPDTLMVDAVNGSVTVSMSERDDVRLTYTKRGQTAGELDDVKVHTVTEARNMEVTVSYPDSSGVSVDIELEVPDQVSVSQISTTNGKIDLEDIAGDPQLRTRNGQITVEGCDGYVDAKTTNGSIEIRETTGVDHVETVNGAISIELRSMRQDTVIESSSGKIDVQAGTVDADVVITTKVGSIDAPLLDKHSSAIGHVKVDGTLGSGGNTLRLSNSLGKVRLRPLDS